MLSRKAFATISLKYFFVGCMVWRPNPLFKHSTTMSLINKMETRNFVYFLRITQGNSGWISRQHQYLIDIIKSIFRFKQINKTISRLDGRKFKIQNSLLPYFLIQFQRKLLNLNLTLCTVTFGNSTYRCGNYSRAETI